MNLFRDLGGSAAGRIVMLGVPPFCDGAANSTFLCGTCDAIAHLSAQLPMVPTSFPHG
jgi:hypothetical protein